MQSIQAAARRSLASRRAAQQLLLGSELKATASGAAAALSDSLSKLPSASPALAVAAAAFWSNARPGLAGSWHQQDLPFAARGLSTRAANEGPGEKPQGRDSDLVNQEEPFDTITDKIPEKPVGVVEGTSYSLVIIASLALAGATIWAVVKELLLEPKEYTVFNKTLDFIKDDPRVTVRLGGNISGYGSDSRNRSARQRIPNRIYTDSNGVEHVQVQFQAKGAGGGATVHADMYVDGSKQWQYSYLYVDVDAPYPQRLVLVQPQYAAAA